MTSMVAEMGLNPHQLEHQKSEAATSTTSNQYVAVLKGLRQTMCHAKKYTTKIKGPQRSLPPEGGGAGCAAP